RYFFSDGQHRVEDCSEMGVSHLLPTPSWQLDRGRFENFLGDRVREAGVEFLDQAVVRTLGLSESDAPHLVKFDHGGQSHTLAARFVVDASGRAGLIKRKLDLAQPNDHDANAVWWRIDGQTDLDKWSEDPWWRQRFQPARRVNSTNHMCGPGYWFWLIPLASGSHSLGIVCDAKMHPLERMNTHGKAMAWLREHQPGVAAVLEDGRHEVQDFRFLRHFSYGCRQVFSADRWALTGEAGLFLDPFYSPGSDFIAISNGYICELIAAERAGKPIGAHAAVYQQLYFSFYESTLSLYQDQYALFGDALVMPLKVIWDYTYYWSILAPLYTSGRTAALPVLGRLRPTLERAGELNRAMQAMLRDWGARNSAGGAGPLGPLDGRELDQSRMEWFRELNRALSDKIDDDAFVSRIRGNVALMDRLAS